MTASKECEDAYRAVAPSTLVATLDATGAMTAA